MTDLFNLIFTVTVNVTVSTVSSSQGAHALSAFGANSSSVAGQGQVPATDGPAWSAGNLTVMRYKPGVGSGATHLSISIMIRTCSDSTLELLATFCKTSWPSWLHSEAFC